MALIAAVTMTMKTRSGDSVWWFVEFPDYDSIKDLDDGLVEDGTLFGHKLRLEPIGDGRTQRRIIGREDVIIGREAVATITPTHIQIVE